MKRKYQNRLMSVLSIFLTFVFMFVYVSPVLTSNRDANAAVVVAIPMTSITVTGAGNATSVALGATLQMSAAVLPVNATNKVVNWSVVNATGIATISATGLLTATQLGTVTVVARDPNSIIKGMKVITVKAATVPIVIPKTSITVTGAGNVTKVAIGATLQMSAAILPANATNQIVNWSVVNATGLATISATGLLTATQLGTVTVIARDPASVVKGMKVITVTAVIGPVVIAKTSITVIGAGNATTVVSGATLQMNAAILPANATNQTVNWSVVNSTGAATINAAGLLTATGAGLVTVVARDPVSTVKGMLVITVTAPPVVFVRVASITVTGAGNATTVINGNTLQMSAAVLPANATNKAVSWSIAPATGAATINAAGLLTATKLGTVTVVARDTSARVKGLLVVTVTTTPVVDTLAPVLQLIGSNMAPLSNTSTNGYDDPGALVTDNVDGDMGLVYSVDVVDPAILGTKIINYTATDAAGNIGTLTRTVNVVAKMDPLTIPQFMSPLLIPWAMPKSIDPNPTAGTDYYEIAMRQFTQQLLPAPLPMTTVWGYGSTEPGAVFNAPSLTIEAKTNQPTRIKWINDLKDANGNYLPHLLPIDQTITSWPNIQGMTTTPSQTSYVGPVPIITHVHGSHVVQESDGYPEAWYLPAAGGIQMGYATTGPFYAPYKGQAQSGLSWTAGNAVFDYANDQIDNTIWYHDHAMGFTRTNVYAGPAGFYLVRDPAVVVTNSATLAPAVLPGPAPLTMAEYAASIATGSVYEIPIALQDRTFNTDGSLFYPGSRIEFDGYAGPYAPTTDVAPIWNPEFFGDTILVNGKTWPTLNVQPKKYRIRFLNGAQARTFILGLQAILPATANLSFWQIGADGGFLAAPTNLNTVIIMPGERADVIIDFSTAAVGDKILLSNIGPDGPFQGGVPVVDFPVANPLTTGKVMQFTVVAPVGPTDQSTDPSLLVFPAVVPLTPTVPVRGVSLNEVMSTVIDPLTGMSIGPVKALLGTVTNVGGVITAVPKDFMSPLTESIKLNSTEEWEIYNYTADAHPIHLHLVAFQVLNRQAFDPITGLLGAATTITPPQSWETGYKDTVMALPGQVIRIRATFDKAGLYVWHCHILEHEENEMMRPFEVK